MMTETLNFRLLDYVVAVVGVSIAVILDLLLEPYFKGDAPLLAFILAIMLSSLNGGLFPGLFATVLSTFVSAYLFLAPIYSIDIKDSIDRTRGILFFIAGVLTSVICESLHRSKKRAERETQQARESQSKFRALADNNVAGVILADAAGELTYVNDAFLRIVGCSREDFESGHVPQNEIAPPEWIRVGEHALAQTNEHSCRSFEEEYLTGDGNHVSVLVASARVKTDEDSILICTVMDITERKRAEEALRQSEDWFRLMIENVKDHATLMLDKEGKIISWNAGAERLKGYRQDEIIGKHFSCFYPQKDIQASKPGNVLQIATTEGRYEEEGWRVRKDGTQFWANVIITALYDEAENLQQFVKLTRDITERKDTEKALRRSEEQLAGIINSAMDAIITVNETQRIVLFNAAAERMFSYSSEEAVGKSLDHFIPERFRPGHYGHIQNFGRTNVTRRSMASLGAIFGLRSDGEEFPIEASISQLESEGRKFYTVILRDITERKRSEEIIRQSEAHLRRVLNNLFVLVGVIKPDGTLVEANAAPLKAAGVKLEDVCGKKVWDTYWWSYDERVQERIREVVEKAALGISSRFDIDIQVADGNFVTIDYMLAPMRDDKGVITDLIASGVDITDRKRAEKILRESEERYHTLFDSIDEGFCLIEMLFDENGKANDYRFLEINPAFEHLTGIPAEAALREKSIRKLIPDLEEKWFEIYGRVALTGEPVRFEEHSEVMNRWFDVYAFRVFNAESSRVALIFNEITERKRAAEELNQLNLENERQARSFDMLLTSISDMTFTFDRELRFRYANKPVLDLYGKTLEEMVGRNFSDLNFPEDLTLQIRQNLLKVFETGDSVTGETQFPNAAGEIGVYEYIFNPVFSSDGAVASVVGSSREVTERKHAEVEIQELNETLEQKVSERTAELDAVNKELEAFSYSVSHDLRAPLRAMDGFSLALLEDYGGKFDATGQNYLNRVRNACKQMARLIDDMLLLSRVTRSDLVKTNVNLSEIARSIADTLQEISRAKTSRLRLRKTSKLTATVVC
jgi:PAS domain S-box-containing protein